MTKQLYTRVWAWTNLPTNNYVFEANTDLQCAQCDATIPVNSYFARKLIIGKHNPWQHCRQCLPFDIYINSNKVTIAPQQDEYLYVSEVGQ